MKELEVERRVDAETLVPVLNIKKDHEGDAVRVGVAPCPEGDGPKVSASAPQAEKERACVNANEIEGLSQREAGPEPMLEKSYADDYENMARCSEYHGHYNLKEYGPAGELLTPNWPVNTSNIFGLLLRFSEESFWESSYKQYDVGYTFWGEVRYRIWKELLKHGLSPSDADRLMKDAGEFSHNSFWKFHERSGGTQFADNIYEAECDRFLRGKKAGNRILKIDEEPSPTSEVSIQAKSIPALHFLAEDIEEIASAMVRSTKKLAIRFGDRCSGGGYDEKAESVIRTSTHDVKWHLMCAMEQLHRLTETLTRDAKDTRNSNGEMSSTQMPSDQITATKGKTL